jgi:hypothetical protein
MAGRRVLIERVWRLSLVLAISRAQEHTTNFEQVRVLSWGYTNVAHWGLFSHEQPSFLASG